MMNAQQSFMTTMLQRVRPPPPPFPPPRPMGKTMVADSQPAGGNSQPADGPTPGPNWGPDDKDMGTTGFWV